MDQPNWLIVLEYLKVFFSWPVTAIAIILLLNSLYGTEIKNLISRVRKGKVFGHEFEIDPQASAVQLPGEELIPATPSHTPSTLLDTNDLPEELKNDPNALQALQYIRNNSVETLITFRRNSQELYFERIYARTYGTQLRLLIVAASRTRGSTPAHFAGFHAEHLQAEGTTTDLAAYINWLASNSLLEASPNGVEFPNGPVFQITNTGRQFLEYLRTQYGEYFDNRWG